MNCEEFLRLLPDYPDAMPDEPTRSAFLLHTSECPKCAGELAAHEAMLASLHALDDDIEIPEAFSASWRNAVEMDIKPSKPPLLSRWQGWAVAAAAIIAIFGGTSLMRNGLIFSDSNVANSPLYAFNATYKEEAEPPAVIYEAAAPMAKMADSDYAAEAMEDAVEAEAGVMARASGSTADVKPAVIHRSAALTLTSAQYDADMAYIRSQLEASGGWMEHEAVSGKPPVSGCDEGRSAQLRMRIPTDTLDTFIESISGVCTVNTGEAATEDVSISYYDAQDRLEAYAAQQSRLVEMYNGATETADLIQIDERLSSVQSTIDALSEEIDQWDSRADNAVVSISVTEISPETESDADTLGQRLGSLLRRSFESARLFAGDMLVFLVMAAPYILCAIVIGFIVLVLYRAIRSKRNKEKKS